MARKAGAEERAMRHVLGSIDAACGGKRSVRSVPTILLRRGRVAGGRGIAVRRRWMVRVRKGEQEEETGSFGSESRSGPDRRGGREVR